MEMEGQERGKAPEADMVAAGAVSGQTMMQESQKLPKAAVGPEKAAKAERGAEKKCGTSVTAADCRTAPQLRLPEDVRYILRKLEAAGHEAFAVGGCVRDSLLGRNPEDWDITTSARPEEVKAVFHKTIDTGIAHGTVTVLLKRGQSAPNETAGASAAGTNAAGTENEPRDPRLPGAKPLRGYEVTTYRIDGVYLDGRHPQSVTFTPSLEEDLKRRDFTINAMAYNERAGLVDLFSGIEDLQKGMIRCVGAPVERFSEDALRMLRAVRFSAQLGFAIDEATADAARLLAKDLQQVSKERVLTELSKLLCSAHADQVRLLYALGLAPYICAGFDALDISLFEKLCEDAVWRRNAGGRAEPEKTPGQWMKLQKTARAGTEAVRQETGKKNRAGQALAARLLAYGAEPSAFDLARETPLKNRYARYALLLCGRTKDEVTKLLRALKADNDTIRRASVLAEAGREPVPALRYPLKKLLQKMTPQLFSDLLLLQAALGRDAAAEKAADVFLDIMQREEPVYTKDLAVKGADLLRAGIPAGPDIGRILDAMLEDVLHAPEHNSILYLLSQHVSGGGAQRL